MSKLKTWSQLLILRLMVLAVVSAGVTAGFILAAPSMGSIERVDASCNAFTGAGCGLGWIAANATAEVLQAAHQIGAQDASTAGLNAGPVGNQTKARCLSCEANLREEAKVAQPKPPSCHYELFPGTRTTRSPAKNSDGTFGVEITHTTVYVNVRVCK